MEFIAVIGIPILLMILAAGFMLVSQVTGFMNAGSLSRVRQSSDTAIQQYIVQIALAQSQIYQHGRELEALSAKLVLSNQELGRLNEMKSKFLSMVVHDVRTPLASIRGFSEMLLKKNVGEKEERYLKNIVSSTDQLGRLIADLTDLAMIEAGKMKMDKTTIQFADIAKDILPGVSINAQKKGVDLAVNDLPADCPLNGDKFRLSQALMNLLNNAIKFTPSGNKVELTMRREGKSLVTYVKDSGIGVHPSETKMIFEKFYQAKHQQDEKLKQQGWGLGLSIAQEIIRAHKGEIGVTSPGLGKGATFWFKIPDVV